MFDALAESIEAGWEQLAAAEQANADARGATSFDEAVLQRAYSLYDETVDDYNARPATERATTQYGWTLGDGTVIPVQPALDAFDAFDAWISGAEARLGDRRAALVPAEAAAAGERARLEAAGADFDGLVAQLEPSTATRRQHAEGDIGRQGAARRPSDPVAHVVRRPVVNASRRMRTTAWVA